MICENCGSRPGKSYEGKWTRSTQTDFNKILHESGTASAVLCPECIAESHHTYLRRLGRGAWMFAASGIVLFLLGWLKIGLVNGLPWLKSVAIIPGVVSLTFTALFFGIRRDSPETYAGTLAVSVMNKRSEDGRKDLKAQKKEARRQLDLGLRSRRDGNHEYAVECFTEAIRLDPKASLSFIWRGDAHFQLGDYEEAAEDYSRALAISGFVNPAYYRSRAEVRLKLGDTKGAREDLERAQK